MWPEVAHPPTPLTEQLLRDVVLPFERAWQSGHPPEIRLFLPSDPNCAAELLPELILIDWEHRLRQGLPIEPDVCWRQFPELLPRRGELLSELAQLQNRIASNSNPLTARFELGKVLGQGSTSIVQAGIDRLLRRPVAVKTVRNPQLGWLLSREAQVAAFVQHPGLVPIYDIYQTGPALIIGLVDGCSWDQLPKKPAEATM